MVKLEGNCMTTAMDIMPHRDLEKALQLAIPLDISFWPQLPRRFQASCDGQKRFPNLYYRRSKKGRGRVQAAMIKQAAAATGGSYFGVAGERNKDFCHTAAKIYNQVYQTEIASRPPG